MRCPNCDATLRNTVYEGINIETCPSCRGEWLDATELKKIVQIREQRFDPQERRAIAESMTITPIDIELEDRDLPCPKCSGQTDAINYGGDTGIVIDKCTSCKGIWLDHDEMEKIQMVVEGWEDGLPDDLAKYGDRLRQVEQEAQQRDKVTISRFGFINAMINGILDLPFMT